MQTLHSIVCEPWQRDACMYECHTEWYRAMHGWWMDAWLWWMAMMIRGSFVLVNEWWRGDVELNECMQAWMDWQLFVCVFVYVYVYVIGWLVRVTCLQGGAVSIIGYGSSGTFTNCNFTSNSATRVSLEEEHVDGCMWYVWVHDDAEVVPSIYVFLTDWLTDSFLLPLSVYCDCFLWWAIGLDVTPFSAPLLLFFLLLFAFACTFLECKSFCYLSSHIFSWPSLPSGWSFMNPLSTSS